MRTIASKYVDNSAIIQVIGAVFNSPSLLSYTDKYTITDEDFPDKFHRTIFGAIYKLHELGAEKITLQSIADFLSSRPSSEALYKAQKGEEWLTKAAESAIPNAFDYYYSRLKKFSLLRAYDNCGIDVSFIYDTDSLLDIKKRQLQEDLLDNAKLEEIAQKVDLKVQEIKDRYVNNIYNNTRQAGEGIQNLITKFKDKPSYGVPLYGPLINTVCAGARLGKYYLRSAGQGYGKALPNYTIIPTPNGYRTVEEIKPGDIIFGDNGKPTTVLQIHPQHEQKQVYIVEFDDGRKVKCCKDHLWEYQYEGHRGWNTKIASTEEILIDESKKKIPFKRSHGSTLRGKLKIKLNQPVEYIEKDLYIPPYIFGLMLGDGSFRQHPSNKTFQYSSNDIELVKAIADGMNWDYKRNSELNYTWYFKSKETGDNIKVASLLEKICPDLIDVYSQDKYIPKDYILSSISQRFDILAGLLDTNGNIDDKGRINFTNTSIKLIHDVEEICHSLGFITHISEDKREDKYTESCFVLHIQCPKDVKPQLFKLTRKKIIAEKYKNNSKQDRSRDYLWIENIYPTNEYTDMTCFTVDNDSHLFLANDFIVTHNTRTMIADACYIACDQLYDETFGWIKAGSQEATTYIAVEQDLEELQTMMLAFISNVNEEHIVYGRYTEGEEERVRKAGEILARAPLYVEYLPDFSLNDIESIIYKNIREHGVKYIFWDYLQSSLKILGEIAGRTGGMKLREDNILFIMSAHLKDICNTENVFIMTATQLSGDFAHTDTPDQSLLRGSKAISDRIDIGMILLNVNDEDLKKLQPVLETNVFQTPVIKISVYKNRRGRYKGIYLWCKADLGTCRVQPMFATTWSYELIPIDDIRITIDDQESAF